MTTHKQLTFNEFVSLYYTPIKFTKYTYKGKICYSRYTRNRDSYIFSEEDISDSLDYYNKTGKTP